MAGKSPAYRTQPTEVPVWVHEPFRVFFPLGIAAGMVGLLLWPLFYAGWWPVYPALQHPRLLVFGFGAAFVFGFLGTAWPRFLEARSLQFGELAALVLAWTFAQTAYVAGAIRTGDFAAGSAMLLLLFILGRRLFGRESRDLPPPGFALAFFSVFLGGATALAWACLPMAATPPRLNALLRLVAWQGFLLLPLLGVGSYLFSRFFQVPGQRGGHRPPRHRALAVWSTAGLILASFALEAFDWVRGASALKLAALGIWAAGAVPGVWKGRAPGTRAWGLRLGLCQIALAFLCRLLWPRIDWMFAFEHLLFLGGFGLVILLTGDRVILGHCDDPAAVPPRSRTWRWIVWLMLLTAATRATADLVPSTRTSHHIYAAITLTAILAIWSVLHGRRIGRAAPP